jgi:hypothetical protein
VGNEYFEKDWKSEQDRADFERKLRFALRHRVAPAGLKARVLARAREQRHAHEHGRGWIWRRLAASVVLVAMIGGFAVYREVEERRKGAEAREQVMTALRIANKALDKVNRTLTADSQ